MATVHAKRTTTTPEHLRFVVQLDQMSTGQAISDPSHDVPLCRVRRKQKSPP